MRVNQFYSQNGEDAALSRIFTSDRGVCVEVGANDGVTLSNSYYFDQLGWRSILVEPNPTLCREIRLRRGERTVLFECAASSSNGTGRLNMGSGSDNMYSTLEPSAGDPQTNHSFMEITVPTRTIDSILEEAGLGPIDFVSIDVEGHEMVVLSGIDLGRWKPRIVLLEDNKDLLDDAVQDHMRKAGYLRFYRTGSNDWYARRVERRFALLLQILASGRFNWRGFLKISLPRWIIRPALQVHRIAIVR
jgi:FkbM family methyltransferase